MRFGRLLTIFFVCVIMFLVVGIIENSFRVIKVEERIKLAQDKVEDLKKEKFFYLQDQNKRKDAQYIEKEIRDKLKMIKPGEKMVVLPNSLKEENNASAYRLYSSQNKELVKTSNNLQNWLNLFL
ncbi:hypothetical protein GYA19_01355 [Candidatus Beckwithbacteria bacterium]|nr:hypothetical protein [Candidatus Beckwithbacteria bacterium]